MKEVRRLRQWVEPSLPLEVQAFRVDEGVLAGVPMEPFAEIGFSVAKRLAPRPVFFSGCANGWIGYLPTAGEHEAGGYEVELAPVVYGHLSRWLTPAFFHADDPDKAREEMGNALRRLLEGL